MARSIARPTAGWARVAGCRLPEEYDQVKHRINLVFEEQNFYERLTGHEDVPQHDLHARVARRRAYLHPHRDGGIGLALHHVAGGKHLGVAGRGDDHLVVEEKLVVLAEGFAKDGVPVFLADIKGDLSGLAAAGKPHPKIDERIQTIKIEHYQQRLFPCVFWDLYAKQGYGAGQSYTWGEDASFLCTGGSCAAK